MKEFHHHLMPSLLANDDLLDRYQNIIYRVIVERLTADYVDVKMREQGSRWCANVMAMTQPEVEALVAYGARRLGTKIALGWKDLGGTTYGQIERPQGFRWLSRKPDRIWLSTNHPTRMSTVLHEFAHLAPGGEHHSMNFVDNFVAILREYFALPPAEVETAVAEATAACRRGFIAFMRTETDQFFDAIAPSSPRPATMVQAVVAALATPTPHRFLGALNELGFWVAPVDATSDMARALNAAPTTMSPHFRLVQESPPAEEIDRWIVENGRIKWTAMRQAFDPVASEEVSASTG